MARLEPYASGFSDQQKAEIANQKVLIGQQRVKPLLSRQKAMALRELLAREYASRSRPSQPLDKSKVGRNDPCPCGSGRKFKKCHG